MTGCEPETLGMRIRERRQALGITQAALARKMDVTRVCVTMWELDNNQMSVSILKTLCAHLACSVQWLVTGSHKVRVERLETR